MPEEVIEIVDTEGRTIGIRNRSEVHGDPSLLHKVVHVLVFNDAGQLLLQKRSMKKDVAPGKWDTSVGGHVSPGEDLMVAALREMDEELGIASPAIKPLYSHIFSCPFESELVFTYRCTHNGPFLFNREEIEEVAFWKIDDIRQALGSSMMSDNFESEITIFLSDRQHSL
jgi:isopentenyldiphosphate isomerase